MRAAADDVCGEFADIVPADVRNLMGFYAALRKLLLECGVHDFRFEDLIKPTHERLSKIFSYIINFVRFRESQTGVIDQHFNAAESTKMRIETLYMENQEMESRLASLQREAAATAERGAAKQQRNAELKAKLRQMYQAQQEVVARYEALQKKREELTTDLEEKSELAEKTRKESERLRPYVGLSPAAMAQNLQDLGKSLSDERAQVEALDRRARALQTSTDTFTVVATDVSAASKVLEEVAEELRKEEEEMSRNARQRDALSERGNNVREVEREESLLRRQLAKYQERTEKLHETAREKSESAQKRMEELRGVHRKLTEERAEKNREMERRRVRIEQTEKKVCLLTLLYVIQEGLTRSRWLISRRTLRMRSTMLMTST
jgi:kinetochore protein Nuf2